MLLFYPLTLSSVAFSQCTAPVFDFQNADFPINEAQEAQVCVLIDPFETQTSEELTIEFIIIAGPKAGMYVCTRLHWGLRISTTV